MGTKADRCILVCMHIQLPPAAAKYFWGDDVSQLQWPEHRKYISETLLDKGDVESISWLFERISGQELEQMMPDLRLSAKSRHFWKVYFGC